MENKYKPDYVSCPGETIKDILKERGVTKKEFAKTINLPLEIINKLIKGKLIITPEISLKLEQTLGVPTNFWNNREHSYQKYLNLKVKQNER